ncbi:hypothetical protein ANN_02117 [Periplaneta americana]|uniref:Uncharacterized protein n=1 Tax=Periplaneta americana TaxID=6978 RepID=A0ABQ8TVH0_PERAM|nr:hypothetical protein ANN_02117 [Periplaneta americana]
MAGLCEGGNEPSGSLKASKYLPRDSNARPTGRAGRLRAHLVHGHLRCGTKQRGRKAAVLDSEFSSAQESKVRHASKLEQRTGGSNAVESLEFECSGQSPEVLSWSAVDCLWKSLVRYTVNLSE